MVATNTPTMPSERLQALLTSSRAAHGFSVEDLSRRSNHVFSPRQLSEIERGLLVVDDATMVTLLDLYQVERPLDVGGRGELVIDLVDDCIRIDELSLPLESRRIDDVLARYVSLVHLVRSEEMPAGTVIGLRDDDLDTLAITLDEPAHEIRRRIRQSGRKVRRSDALLRTVGPVVALGSMLAVLAGAFFLTSDPLPTAPTAVQAAAAISPSSGLAQTAGQPAVPVRQDNIPSTTAVAAQVSAPTRPLSARAQAIEARIDWDFRGALADWTIVHGDPHPSWRGVTNTVQRTVTLFDRPDTSVDEAASVLAHELGHAIDIKYLDDAIRREWLALRSIDTGWWAGEAQADFDVGAGDFAEAIAALLLDSPTRSPHGPYTDEQLAFVAALLPGR